MNIKFKLCITSIIFLLSFYFPMFGQNKISSEEKLSQIDALIEQTDYGKALTLLNLYLDEYPEDFDRAQKRIKKIMKIRKEYAQIVDRLINIIITDPGNDKLIYELTSRLESFEKNPSDINLRGIADLKKSAEFNYFRSLFEEIQKNAMDLKKEGQFIFALEKIREGFWLYKDEFEQTYKGSEKLLQVQKNINSSQNKINSYEANDFQKKLREAVNSYVKDVESENFSAMKLSYKKLYEVFEEFSQMRNAIAENAQELLKIQKELSASNMELSQSDGSYLPFMYRFFMGSEKNPEAGIVDIMDAQWNYYFGLCKKAVDSKINFYYEDLCAYTKKRIDDTKVLQLRANKYKKSEYLNLGQNTQLSGLELESKIKNFINQGKDVFNIGLLISNEEKNKKNGQLEKENPQKDLILLSYLENLSGKISELEKKSNKLNEFFFRQNPDSQDNESFNGSVNVEKSSKENIMEIDASQVPALFSSSLQVESITGNKESQILENLSWAKNYFEYSYKNWDILSKLYTENLNRLFDAAETMLGDSWSQVTKYYYNYSKNIFENLKENYKIIQTYNEGFTEKIPEEIFHAIKQDPSVAYDLSFAKNFNKKSELGIYYSYPDIAQSLGEENLIQANKLLEFVVVLKETIMNNYNSNMAWKGDDEIKNLVLDTDAKLSFLQVELSDFLDQCKSETDNSQRKILLSKLAKNEADLRYNEAQKAYKRGDYENARAKLSEAVSKYDEALNYMEDEALRMEVDRKLQVLGEDISKGENELIVREVRVLKNQAKDAYFNGRFEDAQSLLLQAKARWAITNVVEDEEINNLLNFVNTAVSMKTGREISPSAPLYPEMSQILNIAYKYYNEGKVLINQNHRSQGLELLNLSLESLQKLLYVYPLNQEASILTLRINKLKDPKKFADEFSQKVQSARQMCKSKETQQLGYANLVDYYELEPNYPGLKNLIYQVEIEIGIRQKPIDNAKKNQSKEAYIQALDLYNKAGNNIEDLNIALAKINEALSLNSENMEAMNLKDKITTKIGGNTGTVLSTEDERLYQMALTRFRNNDIIGANALINQLLKKAKNQNIQKVRELKVQLDARS